MFAQFAALIWWIMTGPIPTLPTEVIRIQLRSPDRTVDNDRTNSPVFIDPTLRAEVFIFTGS
jgi:hypothetical protein